VTIRAKDTLGGRLEEPLRLADALLLKSVTGDSTACSGVLPGPGDAAERGLQRHRIAKLDYLTMIRSAELQGPWPFTLQARTFHVSQT
jgi:hypothetical protein